MFFDNSTIKEMRNMPANLNLFSEFCRDDVVVCRFSAVLPFPF